MFRGMDQESQKPMCIFILFQKTSEYGIWLSTLKITWLRVIFLLCQHVILIPQTYFSLHTVVLWRATNYGISKFFFCPLRTNFSPFIGDILPVENANLVKTQIILTTLTISKKPSVTPKSKSLSTQYSASSSMKLKSQKFNIFIIPSFHSFLCSEDNFNLNIKILLMLF